MASPADDELITWKKSLRNPILTTAIHGARNISDWRDPFLFSENGATYMVCGGNISAQQWGGGGQVQLYLASNEELTEWRYLGPVFECRDREIINVECPNLFKLDRKWILKDQNPAFQGMEQRDGSSANTVDRIGRFLAPAARARVRKTAGQRHELSCRSIDRYPDSAARRSR